MPVFEVYDDRKPRRIRGDAARITLGRTGDIIIHDRIASRRHCEISKSDYGYILRDLQSRNGTYVNQMVVSSPLALQDADEISIGRATVKFFSEVAQSDTSLPMLPLARAADFAGESRSGSAVNQPAPQGAQRPTQQTHSAAPRTTKTETPSSGEPGARVGMQVAPKHAAPLNLGLDVPIDEPLRQVGRGPVDGGSLTIDDIIPYDFAGKPANGIDPETGQLSRSMMNLKEMLLRSFQVGSTDIHIEAKEDFYQLRYRIDGCLHALGTLDREMIRPLFSVVKLLCNLDINERNVMQDGSFDVRLPDRRVQLRVSIAPNITGDKMVLRVLDTKLAPEGLDSLCIEPYVLEQVRQKANQNSCMVVVCGPTGSGKTTTIYAILRELNARDRNIVTVEQPVEYKLDNVSQIEVSPDQQRGNKITFASALRSLLRQDPDVILVGEIRDEETAQMAVQAAMTGHVLFTTVHARDSIGCIFRMLDLGVEPFMLASALTAVLSQRLMRKLCDNCKMRVRPAIGQLSKYGLDELAGRDLYAAVGCEKCLGIGYKSRIPIFEFLTINDQVRDAIVNRPTIQQLRTAAGDWIFQTLKEDGIRKLRTGMTCLEEYVRVAHQDN